MRRGLIAFAVLVVLMAGCGSKAPHAVDPPAPAPPTRAEPALPATTPVPSPEPVGPAVRTSGEDLEVTGLKNASPTAFSPSGRRMVVREESGAHFLLDTAVPSLAPLAAFDPFDLPVFWSETEIVWQRDGPLKVRDLATGQDRVLHEFGAQVIHYLRPGDTHYVVSRAQGMVQQGYRFGKIVSGRLGSQEEKTLIETGHLIGRMAGGQVLAVEGLRGGPLWSISPTGEKRLLSKEPAFFVQVSPDGKRALWLTGPEPKSSWLDLLKPAVAHADGPYDPPLNHLWTWDGAGAPVRISLGGTFSARAEFSPDGSRVALAMNEGFIGPDMWEKPGRVAVLENGKIRVLATFQGWGGIGMWLGPDGFRFLPPMREKTGGQAPVQRIDLRGEQTTVQGGMWFNPGRPSGEQLMLFWQEGLSPVYWRGAATVARVRYNPNWIGHPYYAPPHSVYLPFAHKDGMRLVKLEHP